MSTEDRRNKPSDEQNKELTYRQNPNSISPEVIASISERIKDKAPHEFAQVFHADHEAATYGDIFTFPFHLYRVGVEEISTSIPIAMRNTHGLSITVISNNEENPFNDWLNGSNAMKYIVATAFLSEAQRRGDNAIELNDRYIDPPPAKEDQIDKAYATAPGLSLYKWEEAEEGLRQASPELHDLIVQTKNELAKYYANRLLNAYANHNLPEEVIEAVKPDIEEQYNDFLMEWALRTYSMFTPYPPELHEVTIVRELED